MSALTVQMEAYAFRQLVAHLQWRSDVQNIDIMNLTGFCRNCLVKWYKAGGKVYGVPVTDDEANERVYGEPIAQWKKRHQTKATDEQLAQFKAGSAKHARTDPGPAMVLGGAVTPQPAGGGVGGHSNVCGQECDTPSLPPVLDEGGVAVDARIAVLTCSDRASRGEYADKSGPAVIEAVSAFAERHRALSVKHVDQQVVPDDRETIVEVLRRWSDQRTSDVIFTTGGTGFGPRDVTPEATSPLLVRSAESLARAMAWQTSFQEPHSVLSRGVCGVTDQGVLVVNLPGNPAAVRQCLAVLLPVLPHALQMLKA